MHYEITPNPKHESYTQTAFLEQVAGYGQSIVIVVTKHDLMDKNQPASLDNLDIPKHHLRHIERVVYEDVNRSPREIIHMAGAK